MEELSAIPVWLCIPFAGLLLSIAVMPLIKPDWWEKASAACSCVLVGTVYCSVCCKVRNVYNGRDSFGMCGK